MDPPLEPVRYICGNCGTENKLKQVGDDMRCPECRYSVIYKKRTRRIVEYEAR